ncbi:MAG: tail fiber domain-containing protein [Proteobacteria bacterium]|nr:tail fiber domain-containing protein [Pseudomonadota bacterium]
MPDRPIPYVQKDPGDIIRSGDWNELQVRAREEVRSHRHTGEADGSQVPRTGIEEHAVDGTRIDPASDVTITNLRVTGDLTVNGNAIIGDIENLLATINDLDSSKVNRTGDTISGSLTVEQDMIVTGKLGIATAGAPAVALDINGSVRGDQAGALRISANSGYVDVGPKSDAWCHFYTDQPKYYFNREIRVDSGLIGSYDENLQLCTAGTARITVDRTSGMATFSGPIRGNQSGALRISANGGYVDVGPRNEGLCHFYTDRPSYYFNREIRVDSGKIGSYNENLSLCTGGTARITVRSDTGRVGIGTTAPIDLFDVYSAGASGSHITMGSHHITLRGVNDPKGYAPRLPYIEWRTASNTRAMFLGWGDTDTKKYVNMRLENTYDLGITGGSVGIGINEPTAPLHVPGGAIMNNLAIGYKPAGVNQTWPYETISTTSSNRNLRLHSHGGIFFHVNNSKNASRGVDRNGGWWSGSSRELKTILDEFTYQQAAAVLNGLEPVQFYYRADDSKKLHAGFIAEDVPDLIANSDHKMISEMDIIAVLTRVVKAQQEELARLAAKLDISLDRDGGGQP